MIVDLGISPAVLLQMQYASEIKEAFFAGGAQPAVQFQITVNALDPKAKEVLLEIDGSKVEYNHRSGAPTPVAITWPGSVGLARITLLPKKRDAENVMSRDGPWAWFRLLDAAEVRRTNVSDRRRVNFRVGGPAGTVRAAVRFGHQPLCPAGDGKIQLSEVDVMAGFGAFGKMPSAGDFFRLNTPGGFVRVWDAWLQQVMLEGQGAYGPGFDAHYMSAPIWRSPCLQALPRGKGDGGSDAFGGPGWPPVSADADGGGAGCRVLLALAALWQGGGSV